MPQIHLEYSTNIQIQFEFSNLFSDIHQVIHTIGNSRIENCKSRAIPRPEYHIGNGSKNNAFVHVEIQWLEGRSNDVKKQLGEKIIQVLQEYFAYMLHELDVQLTVHIIDIARNFYFKYPEGTFSKLK